MEPILEALAKLLMHYGSEILSVGVAALIALIKRWIDKKGLRKSLEEKGVPTETINQVFKIKIKNR